MKHSIGLFFLILSLQLSAQTELKKFQVGIGLAPTIGLGDLSTTTSIGYGVNVQAAYRFKPSIEGFVDASLISFTQKSALYEPVGYYGFLAGSRYIFTNGISAGAGLGYGAISAKNTSGGFAYSPQVGYVSRKYAAYFQYTGLAISGTSSSLIGFKTYYMF